MNDLTLKRNVFLIEFIMSRQLPGAVDPVKFDMRFDTEWSKVTVCKHRKIWIQRKRPERRGQRKRLQRRGHAVCNKLKSENCQKSLLRYQTNLVDKSVRKRLIAFI